MKISASVALLFAVFASGAIAQVSRSSTDPYLSLPGLLGWGKNPDLGWLYSAHYPWVWDFELDWLYFTSESLDPFPGSVWIYSTEVDWFFYSPAFNGWVYAYLKRSGPPVWISHSGLEDYRRGEAIPRHEVGPLPTQQSATILDLAQTQNSLVIHAGYSGCSPNQPFILVADTAVMESFPPQTVLTLVHNVPASVCTAYWEDHLTYDLTRMATEHWGLSHGEQIYLHVEDALGRRTTLLFTYGDVWTQE